MRDTLPNIVMARIQKVLDSGMPSAAELVRACIADALDANASDIHIDPEPSGTQVRLRIDGILYWGAALPASLHAECIARVKILAGLRTDEHATPQDGRFTGTHGANTVDIRVCIMPTYGGENAVLRLLVPRPYALEDLGASIQTVAAIRGAISKPGLVLVVGATGSGKTSTLYAIVQSLVADGLLVGTIEDPVEYHLPGVRHIEAGGLANRTFASGLRSLLRQDPDVLMVGEIRDGETARLAVQAALTGHLVLSSLHAESAAHAIPRLIDLGVDPALLASSARLILSQHLERNTNGRRIGVFEQLVISTPVAAAIRRGAAPEEIESAMKRTEVPTSYA